MWAYYDNDDDVYAVDGNPAAYQLIKYAMAVLIADPNKIIYFPIWDNDLNGRFPERYDAVFTRTELQFRRSEWNKLRRQLNRSHRIENYVLRYDPESLLRYGKTLKASSTYWKYYHKEKQEVSVLWGNTVFLTRLKQTCLECLAHIFELEEKHDFECLPVIGSGWYFTNGWIKYLQEQDKKELLENKEGEV